MAAGQTNTILDAHMQQHPRQFWQRRQPPSALELATAALEECRRDYLDHQQKAEYHAAMVRMLKARDERLVVDIRRLSAKPPQDGTENGL